MEPFGFYGVSSAVKDTDVFLHFQLNYLKSLMMRQGERLKLHCSGKLHSEKWLRGKRYIREWSQMQMEVLCGLAWLLDAFELPVFDDCDRR